METLSITSNPVINFYIYCVFGNGKLWIIPAIWIVWGAVTSLVYIIYSYKNGYLVCTVLCSFIESTVNILFGYHYIKSRKMDRWIINYQTNYGVDTKRCLQIYVERGGWIFLLVSTVLMVFSAIETFITKHNDDDSSNQPGFLTLVYLSVATFYIITVGTSFCLCLLWSLELGLIYHSVEHLQIAEYFAFEPYTPPTYLPPPSLTKHLFSFSHNPRVVGLSQQTWKKMVMMLET